ncbi:MAG TPA: T9SS type B sorting domain-containing protein, partial [Ferruginibacter sp.]|nr:T9SS type B sorting domain-containing protein [Ferruginibacter sp.]
GADVTMCEGKSSQLNANSNASSFVWTPAATLNDPTIVNPVATPTVTTKYYVTGTIGICVLTDSMTVLVNPAPIPNAGPDQTVCYGQNATLQGSGGLNYFWTPSWYLDNTHNQNPVAIRPPGNVTYYLNVIDANGCASLSKDAMTLTVTRPAVVYAGRDTTLAIGQPLPLVAVDVNGVGFTQYEWAPPYGLNDALSQTPTAVLDHSLIYTVTAKTALGCTASDDIKIIVYKGPEIYVPGAFTPDGDGKNDVLRAIPSGIKDFHYFRVYDRWGKLLFTTSDPNYGWNGKLNGTAQGTGTYVWMAEGIDYKGNLIFRKGTTLILQ